jgi:hypothetical protein
VWVLPRQLGPAVLLGPHPHPAPTFFTTRATLCFRLWWLCYSACLAGTWDSKGENECAHSGTLYSF